MSRRGFTLIELLVVISIIGLLSSVVMTSLNSAREKGRVASAKRFSAQIDHIASDQVAGMWDFDECTGTSSVDRSGSATAAVLNGTPLPAWSVNTPFGFGCSLGLNGVNQYANVSPGIAISNSFTVAAWFKTGNGAQTGWRTILSKQTTSAARNYWFGLSGSTSATYGGSYGNLVFLYSVSAAVDVGHVYSLKRVDDDLWHFGAVVYDGSTLNLYLDGVLQNTQTVAAPDQQTADTVIGLYSDLSTNDFNGSIDGVRIFTKTLTASEVGALYAAGLNERHVAYE